MSPRVIAYTHLHPYYKRDAFNHEHSWSRPDDPARARAQRPGHVAYIEASKLRAGLEHEADPRTLIRDYLVQRVEHGAVKGRADVVSALETAARELARLGENLTAVASGALRSIEADTAEATGRMRELLMRAWLRPLVVGMSLFLGICHVTPPPHPDCAMQPVRSVPSNVSSQTTCSATTGDHELESGAVNGSPLPLA